MLPVALFIAHQVRGTHAAAAAAATPEDRERRAPRRRPDREAGEGRPICPADAPGVRTYRPRTSDRGLPLT